jgi:hypothetical protein
MSELTLPLLHVTINILNSPRDYFTQFLETKNVHLYSSIMRTENKLKRFLEFRGENLRYYVIEFGVKGDMYMSITQPG